MKRVVWIAALFLVAVAGYLVVRGLSRVAEQRERSPSAGRLESEAPLRTLRLHFGSTERIGWIAEDRVIVDPATEEELIEAIIEELSRGPLEGIGVPALVSPLRAVFFTPEGIAYLDFVGDFLSRWPQGDGAEWVQLGSLVRSIRENLPGTRLVQILVEGERVEQPPGSIPIDLPLDPLWFEDRIEEENL